MNKNVKKDTSYDNDRSVASREEAMLLTVSWLYFVHILRLNDKAPSIQFCGVDFKAFHHEFLITTFWFKAFHHEFLITTFWLIDWLIDLDEISYRCL